MRTAFDALGPMLASAPSGAWSESDEGPSPGRYRAIFLSDLRLGSEACQAGALLDFLKSHASDNLYLIGDIVDGEQLGLKWYWPQSHNNVVQKLLKRGRRGCRIVYVPGRRDAFALQFSGNSFGGIEVAPEAVHVTARGEAIWITHGHELGNAQSAARWLANVADLLASRLLGRQPRHTIDQVLRFETAVVQEVQRRGYRGVVCGHIRRPQLREVEGVFYCNAGDWVENRTAIVEHHDGRLELVRWAPERAGRTVIKQSSTS